MSTDKPTVVRARVNPCHLAVIAQFYQDKGQLPHSRNALTGQIIEDFYLALVKNGLAEPLDDTNVALRTLHDLGFTRLVDETKRSADYVDLLSRESLAREGTTEDAIQSYMEQLKQGNDDD